MKKILIIFTLLFLLVPTAYAEHNNEEYICEFPKTLYTPPAVSFFSAPTPEEILYNRFENAILSNIKDNALQRTIPISVLGTNLHFNINDATYNLDYLLNIYCNVVYNHPEIGNLITGVNNIKYAADNTTITTVSPMYRPIYNEQAYQALKTEEEKEAYLARTHNVKAFNDAVKCAYSKALSPDMTEDWQKLLSIHDYLADTITYSDIVANGTEEVIKAYQKDTNYLDWTTYSALVGDRISVCQGYSLAFKLLCDMAGIECGYAISENHIWNIAECNGNFYHIDVTWDDPVSVTVSDGNGNTYICTSDHVMHRHFLRSDADSTVLHANEGKWTTNMPACDDSNYLSTLLSGKLADKRFPLYWENGTFWYEEYKYYLYMSTGIVTFEPSGIYYRFINNDFVGAIYEKLEAKIYNAISDTTETSSIAIDGTPNTTADFYAAIYTDDNNLVDVYKTDITFNTYGEAVAEFPAGCNRLFLFTDGGMKPLAYSK